MLLQASVGLTRGSMKHYKNLKNPLDANWERHQECKCISGPMTALQCCLRDFWKGIICGQPKPSSAGRSLHTEPHNYDLPAAISNLWRKLRRLPKHKSLQQFVFWSRWLVQIRLPTCQSQTVDKYPNHPRSLCRPPGWRQQSHGKASAQCLREKSMDLCLNSKNCLLTGSFIVKISNTLHRPQAPWVHLIMWQMVIKHILSRR